MFRICLKGTPVMLEGELVQPALIIINEFEESLFLPLSYWSMENYKQAWLSSLEEGLSNGKHSALAVSMYERAQTNFVFTWVLYFEDETVYLQNNIIFLDKHPDFAPERINEFVDPRFTHDEDGIKISEWNTDINSIIDFYSSLKG